MLSGLRMRLGLVEVSVTPTNIHVEGISTYSLFRDMYRMWGTNVISKNMFTGVRASELKMRHFFGLDFLYICNKLYEDRQTRTPKRILRKVIDALNEKTWLGSVDRDIQSITDMKAIANFIPFPLKPFQEEFVKHYGKMVPAYRLKGYLLDAGAGTGKTITDLLVGEALHADRVIIVSPKNAIERVWEDTIKDILLQKRKYWLSSSNELPSLDHHYYICHYEQLSTILNFVRTNSNKLNNVFVILDESHNFNRIAADRTQMFVELCQMKCVSYSLWASGTPILALGTECIPFLKCVDPLFDAQSEEAFRKIYGASAKRGNEILRNRIGHLKFHVPKQDVVDTEVVVEQVKVKMPNADDYTLEKIAVVMREFIDERTRYYEKNKAHFHEQYNLGLSIFEKTLKNDADRRAYGAYRQAFKLVSSGYDPKLMKAEAQLCNVYELKTILPTLPQAFKNEWKNTRAVVKYVKLKIMGEALGSVVGKMRSQCHLDMVHHIDFSQYIDQAKKKTLIFTSFVDVLEETVKILEDDYKVAAVYGATNKDLSSIVNQFYKDEDLNPLAATYQSLSTAVPLTPANTLLMINQPFRVAIRTQTIARAARLGQDSTVYVFDFLLDTGDKPNISTRSNDILEWSQEQVESILGIDNVDSDTLALESSSWWWGDLLDPEDDELEMESLDASFESVNTLESQPTIDLPNYLYHGSAYMQNELMPGFNRSGVEVNWDKTESNKWLYATDDKTEAIMLGISSAIEKNFPLHRYHLDEKRRELTIEVENVALTYQDIARLHVHIYTIRPEAKDGWQANYNAVNGMSGEYKTQGTIRDNIVRREQVNVARVISGYRINIKTVYPKPSMESLSQIFSSVKKMFVGPDRKERHAGLEQSLDRKDFSAVEKYLSDYFDNQKWIDAQTLNTEVSSSGIADALSVGKFDQVKLLSGVGPALNEFVSTMGKVQSALKPMDEKVQSTFKKYERILLSEIPKGDHDKVEAVCDAANKEYDAIAQSCPLKSMVGKKITFIGGDVVSIDLVKSSPYEVEVSGSSIKSGAPDKIPALTKEQIREAVKLVRSCMEDYKAGKGRLKLLWLDFEDEDVWGDLQDFDDSLYMSYAEDFYHQRIEHHLTDAFPWYADVYQAVVIALLTWIDRSIK